MAKISSNYLSHVPLNRGDAPRGASAPVFSNNLAAGVSGATSNIGLKAPRAPTHYQKPLVDEVGPVIRSRDVQIAANAMLEASFKIAARQDRLVARETVVSMKEELRQLAFGENGYFQTEGRDSVEGLKGYNEAVEEVVKRYMEEASSGVATVMHGSVAAAREQALDNAAKHAFNQDKVWETQVQKLQLEDVMKDLGTITALPPGELLEVVSAEIGNVFPANPDGSVSAKNQLARNAAMEAFMPSIMEAYLDIASINPKDPEDPYVEVEQLMDLISRTQSHATAMDIQNTVDARLIANAKLVKAEEGLREKQEDAFYEANREALAKTIVDSFMDEKVYDWTIERLYQEWEDNNIRYDDYKALQSWLFPSEEEVIDNFSEQEFNRVINSGEFNVEELTNQLFGLTIDKEARNRLQKAITAYGKSSGTRVRADAEEQIDSMLASEFVTYDGSEYDAYVINLDRKYKDMLDEGLISGLSGDDAFRRVQDYHHDTYARALELPLVNFEYEIDLGIIDLDDDTAPSGTPAIQTFASSINRRPASMDDIANMVYQTDQAMSRQTITQEQRDEVMAMIKVYEPIYLRTRQDP